MTVSKLVHEFDIPEVVSKPQIMFEGPAKRDYMSILNRLMDASSVRPIEKAQSRRRRDEPSKEVCNAAIGH
jgi:hypothetical protein